MANLELIEVDVPQWMRDALCAEPAYRALPWFPEKGQSTRPAKAVCADCIVRDECLDYALTLSPIPGIWGGTSDRERRALRPSGARDT